MADFRERLLKAAQSLDDARQCRNRLIVEATDAGLSRREVARAVGLSPAGVQHVLQQYRELLAKQR